VHYRGTRERPGLVLGLDRGGAVEGVAYRVAAPNAGAVRAYLRDRELIYGVYREALLPVRLAGADRLIPALTYVAERQHASYAGGLEDGGRVRLVRAASGVAGTNIEYLRNTLRQLSQLGIGEPRLERIAVRAGAFALGSLGQFHAPPSRAIGLVRALASRPVPGVPPAGAHDPHRFVYRRYILAAAK
jgi:cation transport protein ChaC